MIIGQHNIERAQVLNEADWLVERRKYVGSSDAPALFGHGYEQMPSMWSLWAEKTGQITRDQGDEDERQYWGRALEPVILDAVAHRTGWGVLHPMRHDVESWQPGGRLLIPAPFFGQAEDRMHGDVAEDVLAATCDAFVTSHEDGLGLIECKNRDWLQWKDTYTEDDASLRDQLQLAHQFICVPEAKWGVVAVLVGGNELKLYTYTPSDLADQMEQIKDAASELVRRISGELPEPSLTDARDLPAWGRVHRDDGVLDEIVLTGEDALRFDEACQTINDKDAVAKQFAKECRTAKAVVVGIANGEKHTVMRSKKWFVRAKFSPTKEGVVGLPGEVQKVLFAASEKLPADQTLLVKALNDAAAWQAVTRRAGTNTSIKVERTPENPETDIVEDIANTNLGA